MADRPGRWKVAAVAAAEEKVPGREKGESEATSSLFRSGFLISCDQSDDANLPRFCGSS